MMALLVGRFEALCDLLGDRQRFLNRHRAISNAIGERRAFDELHDEPGDPVDFSSP